jgi:universal stress protein A
MAMYTKILIALDFHADNDEIVEKGLSLATSNNAELYFIHVNEPLAVAYGADGMSWSDQVVVLETSIRESARKKMLELSEKASVPIDRCITREGKPAREIHDLVKEKNIDLIVMGTHGQSGLQLLLGSTANSVLHGSTCDVLTVRVGD